MTIEELNNRCKGTFLEHLGIRFISFRDGVMTAELVIDDRHLLPQGYVHGGVYLSMAESVAGAGSLLMVHEEGKTALGSTVNSQHIAAAREGKLFCTGRLIHKAIYKHIWDMEIKDDSGKLISINRVSNSIKEI